MNSINNNAGSSSAAAAAVAAAVSGEPTAGVDQNKSAKAARKEAVGATVLAQDATAPTNTGLVGERKRTGFAALATPPPLPPGQPKITQKGMQAFTSMQSDVTDAIAGASPTNQPKLSGLSNQLAAANTSTPAGAQQAATTQAQMTKVTVGALNVPASSGGIAAFLLLVVGDTDKQKNGQTLLQNLTSKATNTLNKEHLAEQTAQGKAQEKAAAKAAKLAFLKPLMAIVTAVFAVLACTTPLGAALTAIGAVAGFVIGGVKGGKSNGDGFDIKSALSGALMGGSLGGGLAGLLTKLPAMLASMFTKAAGETGLKAGAATGVQAATKQNALQAVTSASRNASDASARSAADKTMLQRVQSAIQDGMKNWNSEDGQGGTVQSTIRKGLKKWNGDDGKGSRLQNITTNVVPAVGTTLQGLSDYAVQRDDIVASKHEAQAKMVQVLEDAMTAQGERNQDAVQNLVDYRKNAMDQVTTMITNHAQTNSNTLGGILR